MGFKIEGVWAFVAVDPEDGDEGVCSFQGADGVHWPMIAANEQRVESLRPLAQTIANATKKKISLIKLSVREELEEICPSSELD